MKKLILIIIIMSLYSAAYADMGSFIVLKSAYLYPNLKGGRKILTRNKQAYPVIHIKVLAKNKLLYQILVPSTQSSAGSGFIVETARDLRARNNRLIKVYKKIPSKNSSLINFRMIPSNALSLTGRRETSANFPLLSFHAVNYKGPIPKLYWVDNWAGVYRLNKNANFLNLSWSELEHANLPLEKKIRILMGLVETDYNKHEVKLALGAPKKEEALAGGELQWVYPQKKVIFEKGKVVRVF